MNRRHFLTVLGGAGVASLAGIRPAFATEPTTTLYLNGLVMVSFEDPILRIGFPKAPAHKATLKIVPVNGTTRTLSLKGNGLIETKAISAAPPKIFVPEVVQMTEFYGPDVKSRLEKCPTVIDIPYAAIKSATTSKVTPDRWTFVRADTQEEIDTFRPRQLAEGMKLELFSNSVLKLDGGKTLIKLDSTQEIVSNYAPDPKDVDPNQYMDHFVHYMPYVDRPPAADFRVVPKKLTGAPISATPRVGSRFWIDASPLCFLCVIKL